MSWREVNAYRDAKPISYIPFHGSWWMVSSEGPLHAVQVEFNISVITQRSFHTKFRLIIILE